MKQQQPANKSFQEFANESHIAKKKKAVQNNTHCKNKRELLNLIDNDEDDIEEYTRYIK